ncbi:hypothetical protein J5N97_024137 [Dioscorea zingiberensis]|uniref:Uncharacterized protein n=1 Tax=Dioscorea zingiberensis TaxID=325984 RepID=A0A9D5C6C0_9LILI|nr:hypothetical protein J5N97_024137 [Dioscorea zingiberensis]
MASSRSVQKSEEEWRAILLPEQFGILRQKGTEHYLFIHVEHIATRRAEDHQLVSHMLNIGQDLLHKDAPESKLYRFRFWAVSTRMAQLPVLGCNQRGDCTPNKLVMSLALKMSS